MSENETDQEPDQNPDDGIVSRIKRVFKRE